MGCTPFKIVDTRSFLNLGTLGVATLPIFIQGYRGKRKKKRKKGKRKRSKRRANNKLPYKVSKRVAAEASSEL